MSLFTFLSLSRASSPFSSQDNLVLIPGDSDRQSAYIRGYDVGSYSLADSINSFVFFFVCFFPLLYSVRCRPEAGPFLQFRQMMNKCNV